MESPVAQWLEHLTRSRRFVGSNPIWGLDFFQVSIWCKQCIMFYFYKKLTCNFFFVQGEEHYQIKCCRCNSVLGSGSTEEKNHSSLHMELRDFNSINLHKHSISLRHSHLFRYSMLNLIWEEINTESIRKLSYFNFLWSKTLYQNNLKNSAFLFTFFKGYRLM